MGAWAEVTQMDVLFGMTSKISHISYFSHWFELSNEQILTIKEQWWEKLMDER